MSKQENLYEMAELYDEPSPNITEKDEGNGKDLANELAEALEKETEAHVPNETPKNIPGDEELPNTKNGELLPTKESDVKSDEMIREILMQAHIEDNLKDRSDDQISGSVSKLLNSELDKKIKDGSDEKKIVDVSEEKKIADVSKEKKIADVSEEKKIADVSEEKKTVDVSDEKKIADVSEEKKIADVSMEKKIADVSEEKKIADVSEEKKIADVSEEKKISDVNNDVEPSNINGTQDTADVGDLLKEQIDDVDLEKEEQKLKSTQNIEQKDVMETQPDSSKAVPKDKEDALLDQIINEELELLKKSEAETEKKDISEHGEIAKEDEEIPKELAEDKTDKEVKDDKKETDETIVEPEDSPGDIYKRSYSIQDDVRFLKFISNLNEQVCSCNRAGNDFVLNDFGSNCHKQGCPSSLSPKDIESIKILFLTRHLPVCKRFLTQSERQVLKNILKTTPYYQIEFFNRHNPYEIQSEGQDLIRNHMVDERNFPKRENQKDILKSKKAILDDLKDILKPAPPVTDPNLNRFPAEEYKFGEKYKDQTKKKVVDINDYPFDYPNTSGNAKTSTNADIMDERLIINLFNDIEAWTCFISICLCDVIQPLEDDKSVCPQSQGEPSDGLKTALMDGVPPEQRKELSVKIDQHIEYLDDLIKGRLKEKIDREREYMQILTDGKLKKEELFVDILSYKNKKGARGKHELSILVNEMFKEIIRNNKEIGKDMENKLSRENVFMERDIYNKMKLKVATELKLGNSKTKLLERYIQEVLRDKCNKEYDLIKSELEFELDRCDEKSLRLFQDVLNQASKERNHEYDNINQYFKALYPPSEEPLERSDVSPSSKDNSWRNRDKSPEKPKRRSPETPKRGSPERKVENHISLDEPYYEKPNRETPNKDRTYESGPNAKTSAKNVTYDDMNNVGKSIRPDRRYEDERSPERKYEDERKPMRVPSSDVLEEYGRPEKALDRREAQTSPLRKKPRSLGDEIDNLMEDLWRDSKDKGELIRDLMNEMRRYDLNEQNPKEKALLTKKSYKDFKDDMDSKLTPMPDRRRPDNFYPNRPQSRQRPISQDVPVDTENILTLFDSDFRYFIVELPMSEQRIELYHDSFYGKRKTLAEISVAGDSRQIRTDIDMKT